MGARRVTRVALSTNSVLQTDTMKLIRTLLDRLSESFLVSVSEKLELATEPSNIPPLRLVSDKPQLAVASGHCALVALPATR